LRERERHYTQQQHGRGHERDAGEHRRRHPQAQHRANHQPRLWRPRCVFNGSARLLGDAESSLGDTKSSLGDAKSSRWVTLGDAKSSLGDAKQAVA
jgi:hypothetical protein